MVAEGVQTVERYIALVLNGMEPDAAAALIAHAVLRRRASALRAAFPDLAVTTALLIADESWVAVHLTGRGTHTGIFQGVPPTGRSWAAGCNAIYRVQAGRIVESWEMWDLLGILEQLGGVRRAATASA
ncbi:MAG: ester cyclase [Candidatus Limnocylindria bacterium]